MTCRHALAALAVLLASCAPSPAPRPAADASPAAFPPFPAPSAVLSTEPWGFDRAAGTLIRTPSYRLFTTLDRGMVIDRMPAFLEHSLARYRAAFPGPDGLLPAPRVAMDSYLVATRPQWVRLTQRMLGNAAEPFLQIQRGGFAHAGRGFFYDIGAHDTFSVAAHEGWHQYTQSVFREPLPLWLEEGIAASMEGFLWDRPESGLAVPRFLPWANVERFDRLREAHAAGRIMPLETLLASSPQALVTQAGDAVLVYYAQAWSLVHFLREGAGGTHRAALDALVHDAAHGRLSRAPAARAGPASTPRLRGREIFETYFGPLDRAQAEYDAFLRAVVGVGAKDKIVRGLSPL